VYIVAFRLGETLRDLEVMYQKSRKIIYILLLKIAGINVYLYWDKFPNRVLFTIYTFILAIEMIFVLWRYEQTTRSSFYFILIGASLFAISDNLLAYLKFNTIKTDLGRGIIMITYYSAQYFIMHGALHQSNL